MPCNFKLFVNLAQKPISPSSKGQIHTYALSSRKAENVYTLREPPFLCSRSRGGAGEQLGQDLQNFRQVTRSGGRGNGAAKGNKLWG